MPGVFAEREPINLAPNKDVSHAEALGKTKKRKSLREYYGENEATYIMDAKKSGNLGRYFNVGFNILLYSRFSDLVLSILFCHAFISALLCT